MFDPDEDAGADNEGGLSTLDSTEQPMPGSPLMAAHRSLDSDNRIRFVKRRRRVISDPIFGLVEAESPLSPSSGLWDRVPDSPSSLASSNASSLVDRSRRSGGREYYQRLRHGSFESIGSDSLDDYKDTMRLRTDGHSGKGHGDRNISEEDDYEVDDEEEEDDDYDDEQYDSDDS